MEDNLMIVRSAKKTLNYIEKNIYNFPNEYIVLKNRILNALYDILENIYRANLTQDKNYKKEIIVQIKMVNFYLKQSYDKEILTKKKYVNYSKYLTELHKMIFGWMSYEKSE